MLVRIAALTPALIWPAVGFGQTIDFDINAEKAEEIGLPADELQSELDALISGDLQLLDPTAYLQQMAEAAALSMKGMGADYGSNPNVFVAGLGLGSAAAGVSPTFVRGDTALPEGGFSFQLSLLAGVNLGLLSPGSDNALDRIMLYANGMALSPGQGREFGVDLYNVGAHVQFELIRPKSLAVVSWGGIDLTAGVERSVYVLSLNQALPIGEDFGPAEVTWDAQGSYTLSAASTSVPIELSTGVRLVFLTLYGGGALDLDFASATSLAQLSGPLEAEVGNLREDLGSATVALESRGDAKFADPRGFAGAQLDLTALKLYGHVNLGLNQTFGGHIGVRVVL